MKEEQKGELILYQAEDETTKIEVRLENENVWLTQKMMAELFQTTPQNITIHLKNIFDEGELQEEATCKDFLQVQVEKAYLDTIKTVQKKISRKAPACRAKGAGRKDEKRHD